MSPLILFFGRLWVSKHNGFVCGSHPSTVRTISMQSRCVRYVRHHERKTGGIWLNDAVVLVACMMPSPQHIMNFPDHDSTEIHPREATFVHSCQSTSTKKFPGLAPPQPYRAQPCVLMAVAAVMPPQWLASHMEWQKRGDECIGSAVKLHA